MMWTPPADVRETTQLGRYLDWLRETRGIDHAGYDELWRWSVDDLEGFWGSLWDFFEIRAHTPVRARARLARDARRRVVHRLAPQLRRAHGGQRRGHSTRSRCSPDRRPATTSTSPSASCASRWRRARAGLQRLGIGPGDRVVAYLPNVPETLVAFLATASLGAIWATCAPEFGPRSVIDRFGQLEPEAAAGDRRLPLRREADRPARRGRRGPRRPAVARARGPRPVPGRRRTTSCRTPLEWDELLAEPGPLEFDPVPFDHPLCVLFSSGTTGLPKAIVHRHGGILIEAFKNEGLSWDLQPGDRLMWFTTTAWMMWMALVNTLLLRASIVMLDGNPMYPDLSAQWRLAEELRPTLMGGVPGIPDGLPQGRRGPAATWTCPASGSSAQRARRSLRRASTGSTSSSARTSCSTSAAAGPTSAPAWCRASPLQPVYSGEIAGRCLAVDVAAYDEDAQPVVGELGELVIRSPMPSMPVGFWNDPDDERYRAAYFEHFPGVWRHGDWIMFTERAAA